MITNSSPNAVAPIGSTVHSPPLLPGIIAKTKSQFDLNSIPRKLSAFRIGCIVLALLTGIAAFFSYDNLRNTVQLIGRDTVPSITAAEHIRAKLADVNANAVNAFLTKGKQSDDYWKAFRDEMDVIHSELLLATKNITYGKEEEEPILSLMANLARYEQLIGMARGQSGIVANNTLSQADKLINDKLLPASAALDQANFNHLSQGFKSHQDHHFTGHLPFIACIGLMIWLLVSVQRFLLVKMRRMINPGLALATLVLLGICGYSFMVFTNADRELTSAKKDAFDSIHALWKARAIAYNANAEESLYLLANGRADEQKQRTKRFKEEADQLFEEGSRNGLLADELNNVTYPGEKYVADHALFMWKLYVEIDKKIRTLETSGDHEEAVKLNIGTEHGQSNWAFDDFDKAVGDTLAINQREFDQGIARAFGWLSPYPWVLSLAVLLMIGGSFVGIKARIDEYRF